MSPIASASDATIIAVACFLPLVRTHITSDNTFFNRSQRHRRSFLLLHIDCYSILSQDTLAPFLRSSRVHTLLFMPGNGVLTSPHTEAFKTMVCQSLLNLWFPNSLLEDRKNPDVIDRSATPRSSRANRPQPSRLFNRDGGTW